MASLAWWQAQLTAAETAAAGYLTAITALSTGTVQSFMLDTGQSVQRVTKKDITQLQKAYSSMLNTVATLEARVNGTGGGQARPAW